MRDLVRSGHMGFGNHRGNPGTDPQNRPSLRKSFRSRQYRPHRLSRALPSPGSHASTAAERTGNGSVLHGKASTDRLLPALSLCGTDRPERPGGETRILPAHLFPVLEPDIPLSTRRISAESANAGGAPASAFRNAGFGNRAPPEFSGSVLFHGTIQETFRRNSARIPQTLHITPFFSAESAIFI